MKLVRGIIFHGNLSHVVHREIVDLHFPVRFAAQKTLFSRGSLYKKSAMLVQNCKRKTQEVGNWSPVVCPTVLWAQHVLLPSARCARLFLPAFLLAPPWILEENDAAESNTKAQETFGNKSSQQSWMVSKYSPDSFTRTLEHLFASQQSFSFGIMTPRRQLR